MSLSSCRMLVWGFIEVSVSGMGLSAIGPVHTFTQFHLALVC